MHSLDGVSMMNSVATKILRRAQTAFKADPEHEWAADLVELTEMLQDREKQLVALNERVGVRMTTSPTGPVPAG